MLRKVRKNHIKITSVIILLIMILNFFEIFTNISNADSYRYTYNGDNLNTNAYPGYKERIDQIKSVHPNWNIVIMETNLDWNQVVVAESSFSSSESPYSLIQGKGGSWICSSCGSKTYDSGSWYHASESAIKYYLDPRNWMDPNSSTILQFLQIGRVDTSTQDIYNAISGTFLNNDNLGWSNAEAINNACRNNNANPYYIIARIIQEQGVNGGATYKMAADGKYYYNIFNIGASGDGTDAIVANALAKAKSKGWDSLERCIEGGIQTLFSDYINQKQDTIYLNKFDVETYGGLYHQYMQNIEAPKSEANLMYSKIKNSGILNQPMTLVIPVFLNMPYNPCSSPDTTGELSPKNIRVKEGHSDINVRESRSTSSRIVTTLKNSEVIVLSVERYGDGWHKIILTDGTIGYVFFDTKYLEEIDDITNCYESMIVMGDGVNLRTGPSSSLPVISSLTYGQQLTRIDNTGRYNIDGNIWDRVVLSDGRQGFASRTYLQYANDVNNLYTIKADGGLFLRRAPAGEAIRLLPDGTSVVRTEIGTNEINGYFWDKVTTPDGAVGYVARSYLRDKYGNVPSGNVDDPNNSQSNPTTQIKTRKDDESKIIYAEPNVNENTLKNDFGNEISITKSDGSNIEKGIIGTGYKVKINGQEYSIIKLGDINCDGAINSGDTYLIKRIILRYLSADTNELKLSADVNGDGTINTGDSYLLKRDVLNLAEIVLY